MLSTVSLHFFFLFLHHANTSHKIASFIHQTKMAPKVLVVLTSVDALPDNSPSGWYLVRNIAFVYLFRGPMTNNSQHSRNSLTRLTFSRAKST